MPLHLFILGKQWSREYLTKMSLKRTRIMKELELIKSNLDAETFQLIISESNLNFNEIKFEVLGPSGTPLENKKYVLTISPSDRYPLEPPSARFDTHIRHPNVDEVSGRICLDLLRMPPEGSWKPNISLPTLLTCIHALLGAPNLDDPIRPDLVSEWRQSVMTDLQKSMDEKENFSNSDPIPKRPASVTSLSLSRIRKKKKLETENLSPSE